MLSTEVVVITFTSLYSAFHRSVMVLVLISNVDLVCSVCWAGVDGGGVSVGDDDDDDDDNSDHDVDDDDD